jgi:hypothetical protein
MMKKMKYLLYAAAILSAYACSSTLDAGNNATDDVYYSSANQNPSAIPSREAYYNNDQENYQSDNSGQTQQQNENYQNYTTTEQTTDGSGNTYITNNYNGDYYDYEYSSKIKRFYEPAYGYGYYDPYYTNSYWYDYNPYSWGVSIYLGYNWWAPASYYYSPFCYGGWSVGFGYGSCGYYPYYPTPYYSYPYYGYYPYPYYGYNPGYYCGNPNPYYYNSYDNYSTYYGPRGSVSSNSKISSGQRQSTLAPVSANYQKALEDGKVKRNDAEGAIKSSAGTQERKLSQENKNPLDARDQKPKTESTSDRANPNNGTTGDFKDNSSDKAKSNQSLPTDRENSIKSGKSATDKSQSTESRQQTGGINSNPTGTRNTSQGAKQGEVKTSTEKQSTRQTVTGTAPNTNKQNTEKENNVSPNENKKTNNDSRKRQNYSNPKEESSNESFDNSKLKKETFREMPSRKENKTPVFQPRNEPKQFKQESAPMHQRSQPPQNKNNSGGGNRR